MGFLQKVTASNSGLKKLEEGVKEVAEDLTVLIFRDTYLTEQGVRIAQAIDNGLSKAKGLTETEKAEFIKTIKLNLK